MVDDKITTEEKFSFSEDIHLPQQHLHSSRKYSVAEEIKEILKEISATNELFRSSTVFDTELKTTENWNTELIWKKLATISTKLLTRSPADCESLSCVEEIRDLEKAYKHVMDEFLYKMDIFLRSAKELQNELITTLKEFRMYSRGTAYVTLATSITNIFLAMGGLMQKMFHFSWNPSISVLHYVMTGMSFTISLLTLSYMRQTTSEISRDMRKENRFLLDLIVAHRKGDWIDEKVLGLFPFGINLNLIDKKGLEGKNYFEHKSSWKKDLCSAIILSNIQKDTVLLNDEKFLTTVKLFVENPASEIWWSRMNMKRLLDEVRRETENVSFKELISCHEQYMCRTVTYLYPVLIPYLVSSWNSEEMRFICSTTAGIIAAFDVGNGETEELEDLKKISHSFVKNLKEINKTWEILNSYD